MRAVDTLSHNHLLLFFAQVPNATREPSVIPQELLNMLVNHQPDWTSRDWRSLYSSIFQKVWPVVHIRQGRLVM